MSIIPKNQNNTDIVTIDIETVKKIGKRLRMIRKEILRITQKDFVKLFNFSQGYYTGFENGKYLITTEMLFKLKDTYGVNPNWILTGEGDIFLNKTGTTDKIFSNSLSITKDESKPPPIDNIVSISDFIGLPLMDGKISAGSGSVAINNIKATLMFRRDWLSKFGDPHKLSLIEVVGDSMEPTFKSGDIILVNHNQNTLNKAGGIYAIAIKNEDSIMVKRLQYDYQSGKILVISDNKLYQTFQVSEDEIVINGRVVWYGREI